MSTRLPLLALLFGLAACGHAAANVAVVPPQLPPHPPDTRSFDAALAEFVAHDAASDWTDAKCSDIANAFEAEAEKGSKFPEASYDAGLAWQRCDHRAEAKSDFERALAIDPHFHPARVQLALLGYASGGKIDDAITAIQQAVVDAQFRNVDALVQLAALQIKRHAAIAGSGCASDMECAKLNLQRALAQDDGYMPAMNQLALYYFGTARDRASEGKRADTQQLELAALVCSQAIRKNGSYAPIHNTAGLIQNELGNVNAAVAEFGTAARLDPRFFEAQLNLALANLSFRGFAQAETALRKAIALRPNDYDAHLALALALRGQITGATDDEIAAVQAELDLCKKLDPERADAYYNEAILTHQYKAKASNPADVARALSNAKSQYLDFVKKAGSNPRYAAAVRRARGDGANDRGLVGDIEDTLNFIGATPTTTTTTNAPPVPHP